MPILYVRIGLLSVRTGGKIKMLGDLKVKDQQVGKFSFRKRHDRPQGHSSLQETKRTND